MNALAEAPLITYINEDRPFGPTSTENVVDDKVAWEQIFDTENEIVAYLDANDPVFLIGRRGSGKTAFLRSGRFRDRWTVDLSGPATIISIRDTLEAFASNSRSTSVEHWERLWNVSLWHVVFHAIVQNELQSAVEGWRFLDRYLHALLGEDQLPNARGGDVLSAFCRQLRSASLGQESIPFHERPELLAVGDGLTAQKAIEAAQSFLATVGKKVELQIDSLEQLQEPMRQYEIALSGLYSHVWRCASDETTCTVRLALPAETWHTLKEYSSAPLRHFERHIVLQWTPVDLARIAGQRLLIYLREHQPELIRGEFADIADQKVLTRREAYRLLTHVLPSQISGEQDVLEPSIGYIMRHTQLNPRQFLQLLNSICVANRTQGRAVSDINRISVVSGIQRVEEQIILEINRSYSSVHPEAHETCKAVLGELPRVFSHGDLEKVFRREGASAARRVFEDLANRWGGDDDGVETYSRLLDPEYLDFKDMLTEIGCIGKVVEHKGTFVVGEFEFSAPSRLQLGTSDLMCVHPLFSGVYSSRASTSGDFVVQARGAEVDLEL